MIVRLVVFLQFVTFICAGQEVSWQPVTISDGLSQGMVYDLLEDREGFLWFATKDGLNRYDGYKFKIFKHKANDENSLGDNFVIRVSEGPDKKRWVHTLRVH